MFIKAHGLIICLKVEETLNLVLELPTQDRSVLECSMDSERKLKKITHHTQALSHLVGKKVKVYISGRTVLNTMVSGRIMNFMVLVLTSGKMIGSIRVSGKMEKDTALVNTIGLIRGPIQVSITMKSNMVMESTSGQMVDAIEVTGRMVSRMDLLISKL